MKKYFLLLLISSFTICSFGQIKERQAVDRLFADWNKDDVPGCALGIIEDGKLIYSQGYGIGDLEHDIKISPSSVFYIGSVSKQFVTFCILLLEEQGKLDLDDRIQKFLPDFPDYGNPLTIRHFVHHTSGVRDFLTLMYLKGRDYLDNTEVDEVYELIKKQKELNFSPGEKYLYSNSCYFMLAMIVEKAAGQSIKEFAHEHIFQPLGMKNSLFYDDNTELIKNRVFSYSKKSNEDGFNNLIMRFHLVGSGGVYSTVEDLFLWDQNFYKNKLGKGGQGIINRMHEEGLLNNGKSSGYAFALNNGTYKGLKTVSHGGSLAGYRAELMRFPDEKFSVIILANRSDAKSTTKSYQVADILLKDKFINEPIAKKVQQEKAKYTDASKGLSLKQLTGDYEITPGVVIEVSVKNNALHIFQSWNKSSYEIKHASGNTYEIANKPDMLFVFSGLKNDNAQELAVFENTNETIFKRKKEIDPSALKLEAYTGQYYSVELDATYNVRLEDGVLKLKIASYEAQELIRSDIDTFTSQYGTVRFNNSQEGRSGFRLDAGRVRNLKFVKK